MNLNDRGLGYLVFNEADSTRFGFFFVLVKSELLKNTQWMNWMKRKETATVFLKTHWGSSARWIFHQCDREEEAAIDLKNREHKWQYPRSKTGGGEEQIWRASLLINKNAMQHTHTGRKKWKWKHLERDYSRNCCWSICTIRVHADALVIQLWNNWIDSSEDQERGHNWPWNQFPVCVCSAKPIY